eukprot:scaffold25470_cov25-Tisochrysis_lutea.AAC.3
MGSSQWASTLPYRASTHSLHTSYHNTRRFSGDGRRTGGGKGGGAKILHGDKSMMAPRLSQEHARAMS